MRFGFASFKIDTQARELLEKGQPVAVEPQVFDVIAYLVENRARIISKDELVEAIWDGRAVSDAAITSRISFARSALGDSGKTQTVIRTIPRKGFRFVAEGQTDGSDPATNNQRFAERPAIAVLPFANLTAKPEDEIIGEGICEDLTTALSSVRLYRIVSRSSTSKYKERNPEHSELATDLGAAFAVTGSFRRIEDQLRVSVQLDDVERKTQVWARRFDGRYSDLFDIQDQIIEALLGQLEPELDRLSFQRTMTASPNQMSAWELYHRAMILVAERKMETTLLARDYFKRAIDLAPDFSRPYAGLAYVYTHMAVTTGEYLKGDEFLETARRAVAIDGSDYLSQTALANALYIRRDFENSAKAHERSIQLNPHNAQSRAWYATTLIGLGQAERAIPQLELAIKLSPDDPWIGPFYGRLTRAHYFVGNIEAAVEAAEAAFNHPHHWPVHACYAACMIRLDRKKEAKLALQRLREKQPDISKAFIQDFLPELCTPYAETLINDLSKAGLA